MRLRSNGQLTLPAALRRAADLKEGDALGLMLLDDGSLNLKPIVVMDRLEADLLLRLQLREPARIASADLQSRAGDLAAARAAALAAGDNLEELVGHYRQGHLSRRAFIGHALSLGLPPSTITTLLATQEEHRDRRVEPGTLDQDGEEVPGAGLQRVRIAQAFQSLLYLPLYIARDAGFLDEEGLEVEVTTAGGGPEAWAQVASGEADYSIHDPVFAVAAYEGGMQDAVVVGTVCNGQAILAAARDPDLRPTENPRRFITETARGRTVVTQPRPDSQWAVLSYLDFLYGTRMGRDYRNVQVQIGTEMEAVLAGTGDIGTSFPPAADLGVAAGLRELFDFSRSFGPYVLSALCSRRSRLRTLRGEHHALLRALEKAAQYAYAFPEEAVKVAQREFPAQDPRVIGEATKRCLARQYVPEHVFVGGEAWRESQILNKFVGTLREYHEPYEVVDNDAALLAYRSLGHLALSWRGPRPVGGRARGRGGQTRSGQTRSAQTQRRSGVRNGGGPDSP